MSPRDIAFATLCTAAALVACSAGTQSAQPVERHASPVALAATSDVPDASTDASREAPSSASTASRVTTRTPSQVAALEDHWHTLAPMTPLGSRQALTARLQRIARARIAQMSPDDRRASLEDHRDRLRARARGRFGALRSVGSASGSIDDLLSSVRSPSPPPSPSPAPSTASSQSARPSSPTSVTNNQVADVDEGDIVKAVGEELVILRRGNLFRVSLANGGVRLVGSAPAYPPHTRPGDWYDELLVDRDVALVLGYDYRADATEVNRFRLEAGGALRYLDSFYVRSNDYYSSENYASRLVGGRFLLYVPVSLELDDPWSPRVKVPTVRVGRAGAFQEPLNYTRLFASEALSTALTLHTLITCDIHGPRVTCSAQGVVGGSSRSFYVSQTAVYVWTDPPDDAIEGASPGASWIVRLPLSSRQAPGAASIHGGPSDQFAFDERDGALHLLLRAQGRGEAMWSALGDTGSVSALRVPLSHFDGVVSDAPADAYTVLLDPGAGSFHERWVGDYALFGTGRSAYGDETIRAGHTCFAYRSRDATLFELHTRHGVERIEALGSNALTVGNDGSTLKLTPVALDGPLPRLVDPFAVPDQAQGETRSHAFFFRPTGEQDGLFGIATTQQAETGRHQLVGASDVTFFRMEHLALSRLGALEARGLEERRCTASCADWYGNTRPIFWGERVFALLGDEIAEAHIDGASLTERARVDFGRDVATVIAAEEQ